MPPAVGLPDHEPAILPLHTSHTAKYRALHTSYPSRNLESKILEALTDLADASADLGERRRVREEYHEDPEEDEESEAIAQLGKQVEDSARALLDKAEAGKVQKTVLTDLSDRDKARGDTEGQQPLLSYEEDFNSKMNVYNRKDLKSRYGNVSEYIDYRKIIYAQSKPNAALPNTRELLRTPIFVTRIKLANDDDEEDGAEADDDDEFQITNVTQSLKCPLTMKFYEDPVETPCKHVYEKDAILQTIEITRRNHPRGRNQPPFICPTPGCVQAITKDNLKEAKWMKRLVEAEIRKQERERRQAEDDEVEAEPSTSRSKSRNQRIILEDNDDEEEVSSSNRRSIAKIKEELASQRQASSRASRSNLVVQEEEEDAEGTDSNEEAMGDAPDGEEGEEEDDDDDMDDDE